MASSWRSKATKMRTASSGGKPGCVTSKMTTPVTLPYLAVHSVPTCTGQLRPLPPTGQKPAWCTPPMALPARTCIPSAIKARIDWSSCQPSRHRSRGLVRNSATEIRQGAACAPCVAALTQSVIRWPQDAAGKRSKRAKNPPRTNWVADARVALERAINVTLEVLDGSLLWTDAHIVLEVRLLSHCFVSHRQERGEP